MAGDLTTVNLPGIGQILYADCLAAGGSVFGCSPLGELVSFFGGLFSGVPKMLKTIEAQARLAQSVLPPFKQLAANLEIWVRNGVPLSTGDPKLRAQLTGWIHGTLFNSGLGLRVQPNGFDQFSATDTTLWRVFASQYALSGRALDQLVLNFQRVNYVLDHRPVPQPPPPNPKPPPPPPPACQTFTPAKLIAIGTICFATAPDWPLFFACVLEKLSITLAEATACQLQLRMRQIWDLLTRSHPPPKPPPIPDPPLPDAILQLADGTVRRVGSPRPMPHHMILATAGRMCAACESESFDEE